jgi:hypothetical protein
VINVTSTTGMVPGNILAIQNSGGVLEVVRIESISGSAITVLPNLSSAPAAAGQVTQFYNFSPEQAHSGSLSFQRAKFGDSNQQWQVTGATGDLELTLERGQLPKIAATLKGTTWVGPSSQGFSTAAAADTMLTPPAIRAATVLVQGIATTTRVSYPVHKFALKVNGGMMQIPELFANEGVNGVLRIPSRAFGQVTITCPSDPTLDATWSAQTKQSIMMIMTIGSGLTQRFVVIDCPTCMPYGKPKFTDESGRMVSEQTYQLMEDETTSGSTIDLALAPVRIAYG